MDIFKCCCKYLMSSMMDGLILPIHSTLIITLPTSSFILFRCFFVFAEVFYHFLNTASHHMVISQSRSIKVKCQEKVVEVSLCTIMTL